MKPSIRKPLTRLLPLLLAVAALSGTQAASAMDRSPTADSYSDADTLALALAQGPLTREQVREELHQAQALHLLNPGGELGDTPEVLQAREAFYAQQRAIVEQHQAQVQEAERLAALQSEVAQGLPETVRDTVYLMHGATPETVALNCLEDSAAGLAVCVLGVSGEAGESGVQAIDID